MPVVLTMLSLPGSRWKQNNNDKDDLRIWQSDNYQKQVAKFWHDIALALKPYANIIIAYNILNEPHPERLYDTKSQNINTVEQEAVQKSMQILNQQIVNSIRQVDKQVPIILDSSSYADPKCFKDMIVIDDPYIIYSFHMYEPYSYTNLKQNKGKFQYPGKVNGEYWDKAKLIEYLSTVIEFQKKYNIPSSRILAGEFGGNRHSKGLEHYFKDLTDIFKDNQWHSAFYAFREDNWEGMNYELGNKPVPYQYWQDIEASRVPKLSYDPNNALFSVLKNY